MSTVWLVGQPDDWQDEFAETLSGFFGIRRIAGLRNFGRLITIADDPVDQCAYCIIRLTPSDPVMSIHASLSRFLREHHPSQVCAVGDLTNEQRSLLEGLGVANIGWPSDMIQTAKLIKSLIRPPERKSGASSRSDFITFGDVEINIPKGRLRVLATGVDEPLTPKEIRILQVLSSAMNTAVGRDELIDQVWAGLKVSSSTVDSHMSRLRKKFEQSFECQLETKYGCGWILSVSGAANR